MPSERVQRRIDRLLDQAEEAADRDDWSEVSRVARMVLKADDANGDARTFLSMVDESGIEVLTPQSVSEPAPISDGGSSVPTSFASGRYTVSKFLGEGGKKKVYLAHDSTLDRDVAFALIKTEGLDETSRERVRREAQAMGRMGTHPCIMPIYDLGEEVDANGTLQPYMVQPLMVGGDVEGLVEDAEGPLELDRALEIATQTAQGLSFAHGKGIVHRDLKPGNVWLDEEGAAKIGDFGLAVATDRSRLTVEKVMVGTVSYMPPEQATGGEVTPRADLYSLGAMLYEMCTGRVPFMGDDDIAIISQHINTPPVAPSWHNSQIPKTLDSLILRMMAKDPAERPESADEVLAALGSVDLSAVSEDDSEKQASLDSMAGGVFVGRHREMDLLKAGFEEVLSGRGRMVTLVGEPGIGKTRTAQELATYAGMRGANVLWGRSYESGGEPAYWPWVQAIRSHVADTEPDELRRQLGATAPILSEVVPDIKQSLPEVQPPPVIEDPESARFRLFDSISNFLKQVSSKTPLVLMLEDLQWSDRPSLMLLEFVARELANSRILIVGNYRDVDLNRRHPLSVTLGELTRERLFQRVVLRGLQRHDVERFIEIAAGIAPPATLVDTVHTQTEGNPLFVTETVRLLIQEGEIASGQTANAGTTSWEIRIPEGVREVIGRRLDRLSERCNEVLTTAAVIGRQFRFPVLLKLSDDVSENMLLDVLDEALSGRVVEELPEEVGLYQFTHALMRETLTSELSLTRRVRLHSRIAAALEDHYGARADEHATELVLHLEQSASEADHEKLLHFLLLSAREALASYSYVSARTYLENILELVGDQHFEDQVEVEFGLARSLLATTDLDTMQQGVIHFERAFTRAVANADIKTAITIAAMPMPSVAQLTGLAPILEQGLDLVEKGTVTEGHLLTHYSERLYYETADKEKTNEAADRAIELARSLGDDGLLAWALAKSSAIAAHQANVPRCVELSRDAVQMGMKINDPLVVSHSSFHFLSKGMAMGFVDEVKKVMASGLEASERTGQVWRINSSYMVQAYVHLLTGKWDHAKEDIAKSISLNPDDWRIAQIQAIIQFGSGDLEAARSTINRMIRGTRTTTDDYGIMSSAIAGSLQSRFDDRNNHVDQAIEMGRSLLSRPTTTELIREATSAALGWIAIGQGDLDAIREFSDYFDSGHNLPIGSIETMNSGHLLARLHQELGETEKAFERYEQAVEFLKTAGLGPELVWTSADFADFLANRNAPGDREKAFELQDEAIAIATELGMKPLLERVLAKREILKA